MRAISMVACVAPLLLLAASSQAKDDAEALSIAPCQWEFELSTMLMSATEPQVNRRSQCVKSDRLDPASFVLGKEGSPCKISDMVIEGESMRWTQICTMERGSSRAKAEATVNGDSASGRMEMHIMIGSHPVPVVTTWTAKRVGECEPD